ncbi:MAG: FAD-binding oxidoreductase [Geminicoccaceae bacterium]
MSRRVVIVGGGTMGSSAAYWLSREPFDGEITVVERDPTYARASSALSASSVRQQFSTPVNIAIGRFGFGFLKDADATLAVDGEAAAVGLHEEGYLFLAPPAGMPVLEANHRIQRAHAADVELLTPAALTARYPWMSAEGVAGASRGVSGEGWFDGYGLLRAFRRKAIAQGVRYVAGEAAGAEVRDGHVEAIRLADGTRLPCDVVVNTAGPWAGDVAAMLGVDLPVRPRARSVFVIDGPEPLPGCPLVIDTSGVWMRPEGRYYITGISPPAERDPDGAPLEVDHELFEELIWPALALRIPALERLRVVGSWAGYYEYNTVDQNGLVGPHWALDNALFANGFSGHGIQQSPAVGRGLAELVRHGRYVTLDLSPLGLERLRDGRPLIEQAVV